MRLLDEQAPPRREYENDENQQRQDQKFRALSALIAPNPHERISNV
jgi:hypothetical protein